MKHLKRFLESRFQAEEELFYRITNYEFCEGMENTIWFEPKEIK